MSTTILNIIIQLVEAAVSAFPQFAADLKSLLESGAPTAADFAALRAKVAGESYAQFVPDSALPAAGASQPAAVTSPVQPPVESAPRSDAAFIPTTVNADGFHVAA